MVCVLSRSNGVLNLQLAFPPPSLPFQDLQSLLLATRLCRYFPHDRLFLLRSDLLHLQLHPHCSVLLQRWKPGAFDIAGQSHQIFHVFVVLAAVAHSFATLIVMDFRQRSPWC
ncbi:Heptahelical transmembrane protein 2 [Linum perenne]